MLIKGFSNFSIMIPDPFRRDSSLAFEGARLWSSSFRLDADVSHLFPFINTVIEDALYYDNPRYITFSLDGYRCALHPQDVAAAFFEDKKEGIRFAERLIDFLNDLHSRKDSLKPNHEMFKPIPAFDIIKILPGTNCRKCGFLTCTAFAVALSKGKTVPEQCPEFEKPISESAEYPVFDNAGNVVSTVTIGIKPSRDNLERKQSDEEEIEGEREFGLTDREIEVLRLVAEGCTNSEISNSLFISPHTVKSHIIHIFNKLGVNDRTQAAVLATRSNII